MTSDILSLDFAALLAAAAVRIGTPLGFATLGETIGERAGVINLGLEGNLLTAALVSVAVQATTGNLLLAVLGGAMASMLVSLAFAWLTCVRGANQIVTGIVFAFLGAALTALWGRSLVGRKITGLETVRLPVVADVPWLGVALGRHDVLAYLLPFCCAACWWLLYRTRFGLEMRAFGENPTTAASLGLPLRWRVIPATMLGGFLAGLGGAHLALASASAWTERMTAGMGWLAVGLVILARWRPFGALVAAYFFGGLSALNTNLQAAGVQVSHYLLAALPYTLTVVALVWRAWRQRQQSRPDGPESLQQQFAVNRI